MNLLARCWIQRLSSKRSLRASFHIKYGWRQRKSLIVGKSEWGWPRRLVTKQTILLIFLSGISGGIHEKNVFWGCLTRSWVHIPDRSHFTPSWKISLVCFLLSKLFELASDIFQRVSGPHVTFIDPRKHNDTRAMMENACRLHRLFRLQGVSTENVVISVCILSKKGKRRLICSAANSHVFADSSHRGRHTGRATIAEKSSECQSVSRK